jgi:hypothetical protein
MNRFLAFTLVVLSALPFTAPFNVIGLQPIHGAPAGLTVHWQTATGAETPDIDPSALTVPPLVSAQSWVHTGNVALATEQPAVFVFVAAAPHARVSPGIRPPDPPSSRPLALRL